MSDAVAQTGRLDIVDRFGVGIVVVGVMLVSGIVGVWVLEAVVVIARMLIRLQVGGVTLARIRCGMIVGRGEESVSSEERLAVDEVTDVARCENAQTREHGRLIGAHQSVGDISRAEHDERNDEEQVE